MDIDEVCRQATAHRYGGRVAAGHVTKPSALPPERLAEAALRLRDAGVAVTALPSTDLFLMGRGVSHNVPRGVTPVHRLSAHGVTCSLATNNVLNPFTPFGDCSLVRMANLYANVVQAGTPGDLAACFDLVTAQPARLMNFADYGIAVGNPPIWSCWTVPIRRWRLAKFRRRSRATSGDAGVLCARRLRCNRRIKCQSRDKMSDCFANR